MSTAAILAGGRARRLGGVNKCTLPAGGQRFVDRQLAVLRTVADHVLIVANDPEGFADLHVPVVADVIPGAGALGGVYTAIVSAPTERTLVVACDMPFLSAPFLARLLEAGRDVDVAVPRTRDGYQPLCASYARHCAGTIRGRIEAGTLKLTDLLPFVRVREIGPDEIAAYDPDGMLFLNVNTPDDYARVCDLLERRNP
jgi:molybdopterin-guanine dinucleotide biosynthesis protein A